jgi:hypothetical protein
MPHVWHGTCILGSASMPFFVFRSIHSRRIFLQGLYSVPNVPDFSCFSPTTTMPLPMQQDLTIGILGKQVPMRSGTITWSDGNKTVLPAIFDKNNQNKCDAVDIPIIRYMARLPSSDRQSQHVEHLYSDVLKSKHATSIITNCLSMNKCVKISGVPCSPPTGNFDAQYLDEQFGISPLRQVQIHGLHLCPCSLSI